MEGSWKGAERDRKREVWSWEWAEREVGSWEGAEREVGRWEGAEREREGGREVGSRKERER